MKKCSVKRVLAGCLAILMMVNSTSEVWATDLPEETQIEEEFVATATDTAIANLDYSFVDMDGNTVSTGNTTENTVKLVVFDVNQTSSCTPAMALANSDWTSVVADQIQFIWLCYNGTTADNFSVDCMNINSEFNEIKDYGTAKEQEILSRVSVCLNGENQTEAGESLIEEAFLAYWDKVGWSDDERNEKRDTLDEKMGNHFPIVFMINDANEIVEIYQYNDEKEYDFFDSIIADISNYVEKETTCDLPAVAELAVEDEEYGWVTLTWTYPLPDDVYGFKAYCSEDGGITYTEAETNYSEYDGIYRMGLDVSLDRTTGMNKSCTYKVVPLNSDGAEGAEATVTNMGGNETHDIAGTAYNGICFVDENGEKIDALKLHVGEAKKIGLAYYCEDGSEVLLTKTPYTINGESYEKGYNFQIAWWLKKAAGEVSERNLSMITDYESSAVDWLFTKEVTELKEGYFKANALPGENEKYFIEVRVDGPYTDVSEYFCARLPITIVAAEDGATYAQPETLVPVATQEEAYQAMRDLMVARDSSSMVVTVDGLFDNSSTETWLDIDEVYDMYREREGMKPEEGDYLHFTIGDPVETSLIYTEYETYSLNFKGKHYDMYQYGAPFITTRAQEDEVDAKIDELIHTEGGALYEGNYGSDEAKVSAIYNYIVENVSGTVPGDRRTPIYHTAYHALIKGSGTCQAFALLFTRLSREMGIPSKIIMGTDASAHTYNIVELEGKWYYIDTSQGIYLSDANSFVRTEEQEHYQDERYIANYLSKVSETAYGYMPGATLTYTDTDGTVVSTELEDFSAAVAKINSLKTKRDYTITLGLNSVVNTITMPDKNYVKTLTIEGVDTNVKLYHMGNITLTSPTILKNITIERNKLDGKSFGLAIGDYSLTIDGMVFMMSAVDITSGQNGTLNVLEAGQLYMPGTLNVTTLNNAGGLFLWDGNGKGSAKITNANMNNGRLRTEGTIQIVNLKLEGETQVEATGDFVITGSVVSATDKATLYTKLNEKNVPYLNITGTVSLEDETNKIRVGVYAADSGQLQILESGSQLLTVKTAMAEQFVPVAENYPAEEGYFLQKTKTGIYMYYADEIGVALYRGVDTGNLTETNRIGYFVTFADAVATIEDKKDTTADYIIVLLQDVNSENAPKAVSLPSKAKNVIITSASEEVYDIFYTGNISLKANTEFMKVCLNPMNAKGQGVASNIAAGKFNLALSSVYVGNAAGMAIKDVSGSKNRITFASADLTLLGNVSGATEVVIEESLAVKGNIKATTVTIENGRTENEKNKLEVTGSFAVDNLQLQGYAVLDVNGDITVTAIHNGWTENIAGTQVNAIYYKANAKGAPSLTVKGQISGNNATPVELHYDVAGASVSDYALVMKANKYTLNDKQKLVTLEKAALSEITLYLGDTKLENREVVKANKGVYVADAASVNCVLLESNKDGVVTSSYCLDYTQAVNEINNIADAAAHYIIYVGILNAATVESDVTDTNVTDGSAVSAITMPKKGMAASITITSDQGESLAYSGNISYPGDLRINNVVLLPTKDCNLSGTKNVSTVSLVNTSATFKNISNVKVLTLEGADLVTTGTVTVTDVVLSGASHWSALAKTTITNLDVSGSVTGSYIASKQTAKTLVPMFTISGKVTLNATGTPAAWKVLNPEATAGDLSEVDTYTDVCLVVAPREGAGKFMAYPFADDDTTNNENIKADNLISYKTIKNEVASGDKTKMVVRIVEVEGEKVIAETYATSFDEAVTLINNQADTSASYRMELLQGSTYNPILTTKNGTALGKLTLPTKAAEVTIVGANSNGTVEIDYTGSLGINCDTTFENLILAETTSDYFVTVAYSGPYSLTFTENVRAYEGDDLLYLTSVKAPKGKLIMNNVDISMLGDLTINEIGVIGECILGAGGKTAITNISGVGTGSSSDLLQLTYLFNTKNVSQLAINGDITNVKVALIPGMYDAATDQYDFVTAEKIANTQLVTMPKASTADLSLQYQDADENWQMLPGSLYKKNGGLYYTATSPAIQVEAKDEAGNMVYTSRFLEWEEAVKEIDKRAQSGLTYSIILKDNVGGVIGAENPIKTLTLPAKAKKVTVKSEAGELNHIFFQGNKVMLKANTSFEDVGLFAIKKDSKSTAYESVGYTLAAGNYELSIENLQYVESDTIYNVISGITGSAKGTLTLVPGSIEENNLLVTDKISGFGTVNVYNENRDTVITDNQAQSVLVISKGVSGIDTLNLYPGAILSCASSVSVKNANVDGGALLATDITVSQTTYLDNAVLMAGSESTNDGKLKLKDIVIEDLGNYMTAKLDKKGKTQINISGTVTAAQYISGEGAIVVGLFNNDYSSYAQLYNGMELLNAAKAEALWFVPDYTIYDEATGEEIEGMGYAVPGYGLYKSGKEIKYGAL